MVNRDSGIEAVSANEERRAETRQLRDEAVRVTILPGMDFSFDARLVDISPSGFGLLSPYPARPGIRFAVEWAGDPIFGSIMYCVQHGSSYRTGFRKDSNLTEAEHLPATEVHA